MASHYYLVFDVFVECIVGAVSEGTSLLSREKFTVYNELFLHPQAVLGSGVHPCSLQSQPAQGIVSSLTFSTCLRFHPVCALRL